MTRRSFVVAVGCAAALLLAPVPAFAGTSSWGEVVIELTGPGNMVRCVDRYDVTAGTQTFRYLHKSAGVPWSLSAEDGAGVDLNTFKALQSAGALGQESFDQQASTSLGSWYDGKSSAVHSLIHDVTVQTGSAVFYVRTESGGTSDAVPLAEFTTLKAAADRGDRTAFDAAATTAWDTWYTSLSTYDADIVWHILIEFPSAG